MARARRLRRGPVREGRRVNSGLDVHVARPRRLPGPGPGPEVEGRHARALRRRGSWTEVLLVRRGRPRRDPRRDQPDRLDGRGRLRDLPARPEPRRRPVGADHGGRQAARHPADRAVRGAPDRGRHLQLRLGHDDREQPVRGHGPGAAGRAAGRRLHRQGRARADPASRASRASSSASRSTGDALPFELVAAPAGARTTARRSGTSPT